MDVVHGIDALRLVHGRLFIVIGVFDGLHVGHRYLLEHLVLEAAQRKARPAVITFDHHPDEVLTGAAPPLLMDPADRLELLAAAGVEMTIVQHFDDALRTTPYDAFVARIRARVELAGFLMTPDAAFGFERRGTPDLVSALGKARGFDVVVVAPFDLDGHPVSSTAIRSAIAAGDLRAASRLLGRNVGLRATVTGAGPDGAAALGFPLPVALPPDGSYDCVVGGRPGIMRVSGGGASLAPPPDGAQVAIELVHPSAHAVSEVEHDPGKPATIRRS